MVAGEMQTSERLLDEKLMGHQEELEE
jgi:hypothetical protein